MLQRLRQRLANIKQENKDEEQHIRPGTYSAEGQRKLQPKAEGPVQTQPTDGTHNNDSEGKDEIRFKTKSEGRDDERESKRSKESKDSHDNKKRQGRKGGF